MTGWSVDETGATPMRYDKAAGTFVDGVEPGRSAEEQHMYGGTLLYDGQPVTFLGSRLARWQSWTFDGLRRHSVHVPLENGWHLDITVRDLPVGLLDMAGENRRAIDEREKLEAGGAVTAHVGDDWDFSYDKTGYDNPGAYTQWWMLGWSEPEDGPWADVDDVDDFQRRVQFIAGLPCDPAQANSYYSQHIAPTDEEDCA